MSILLHETLITVYRRQRCYGKAQRQPAQWQIICKLLQQGCTGQTRRCADFAEGCTAEMTSICIQIQLQ